jgi:hypothetical protein
MIEPRIDRVHVGTDSAPTTPPHQFLHTIPVLIACLAGLAFYAGAFGTGHFRVPVGDDTYFYVDAIRAAGRLGLATSHLSARPAYPLAAASLGSVAGSSPWTTAVALPFAMAVGVGLAGTALAARWGVRAWGAGLFVVLTTVSVIVGRLVAGRSENLLTVWLLAGALAVAVWSDGWRGKAATWLLVLAAGLTEWPFLAAFLAILGCAALTARLAGRWRHDRWTAAPLTGDGQPGKAARSRVPASGALTLGELAIVSLAAGAAVAIVVFIWNGTVPTDAIQRLPPRSRYAVFLRQTLPEYAPVLTAVLTAIGWWAAKIRSSPAVEPARWLLTTWAIGTILVLLAGLGGIPLPTYRALMFALPIPLALAAAPLLPAGVARATTGRRRALWGALAAVLVGSALIPGTLLWYRGYRPRTTPEALGQIARAGEYAAALPDGRSVVMTYDHPDVLKALLYRRVFEAVLPSNLRDRLLIFPGRAEDALEARPTVRGDEAARMTARTLFAEARPALASGAPILAARSLDSPGFHDARSRGAPLVGLDMAVLRGPSPDPGLASTPGEPFVPLPAWWVLLLRSTAMLAILVLCGLGWARHAAPAAPTVAVFGLAPAFGVAALAILSLLAVRAGFSLVTGAGATVVALAFAASAALLFLWTKRAA